MATMTIFVRIHPGFIVFCPAHVFNPIGYWVFEHIYRMLLPVSVIAYFLNSICGYSANY